MPSYTVTASTSVVLVDTSVLGANQSTIVYLSTATTPGQVVTVRDALGYLSSPQSILVSTAGGVLFTDGTSSLRFTTPYASASFSADGPGTWNIINTFGFPLNNTVANVKSLAASTLIGQSLNIGGGLSTATVTGNSLIVQSTATVSGALTAGSLYVGPTPSTLFQGETVLDGTTTITGGITANALFVSGGAASISTGLITSIGDVFIGGNLTTTGVASVQGSLSTTAGGAITAGSLSVASSATILGQATFNSNLNVLSNVVVGQSTITTSLTATTATLGAGGFLQLNTPFGPVLSNRTDILAGSNTAAWNAPLYAPYISCGTLLVSSTATVNTLTVRNVISAQSLTQFLMSSAQIQNPSGSLVVSSLAANSLTLSNTFTTASLGVSSLLASSIQVAGTIQSLAGFVSTGVLNSSTISSGQISTGQLNAGVIITPAVSVSSLYVNRTIDGATNLSSVSFPNAVINNSAGRLTTATLLTNQLTASSLTVTSGLITSPSTIRIQASTVALDNPYFSSLTTSSLQVSTLTATRLTLGAQTTSNSPDFVYDTAQGVSTNVLVSGGPGNFLTPFYLSNQIPPGQNPAVAYTTFIGFNADFKGVAPPPGMVIDYAATLFWAGQVNSQIAIGGGPTLSGTSGANVSTTGTLAQSTFSINASLFGSSAISVTFQFRYSPNANYVDSNAGIQFNNGRLNWAYALNGTTIQNSLNDMTTRNLFYYGSLNFASDPRLKEDIQDADLAICYETIRDLPIRQFRYCSAYCSTFQVDSDPRLGVLATDVQRAFPKSVHLSDTLMPSFGEPLLTVDTAQIEMAHIGATKYLMREVERLEALLQDVLPN